MAQRKYVEFGYIKHPQNTRHRHTNNKVIDTNKPRVVSKEELIAMIRADTGQSDFTVREVIRLFAEYVDKKLETQDEIYITMPKEPDMLIKKVDVN